MSAKKTHCKKGHPLVAPNLYIEANGRRCRMCAKARVSSQWYAEKAARKEKRPVSTPQYKSPPTYGRNWGSGLGSVVGELLSRRGSYE
jgi:hypothetical protein